MSMHSLPDMCYRSSCQVVPCMSLIVAGLGEKLKSISREGQDTIAKLSSYLNEVASYHQKSF